jgi:LPS export ABC transporter protein LptC
MTIQKKYKLLSRIPVIIAVTGILFSCVNDLDSIQKVTYSPNDPDERTTDLEIFYTDSGYAKVQLFAKLAETYSKPTSVVKMKDGLKVHFFDDFGNVTSILTALYGEIHQQEGMILVRDSVELYNVEKQQRLETEELRWRQQDSTIYTEKSVVVKSPESIFFGKGIRTKQDFSSYEFLKPTGKIDLSKQKLN